MMLNLSRDQVILMKTQFSDFALHLYVIITGCFELLIFYKLDLRFESLLILALNNYGKNFFKSDRCYVYCINSMTA